jgi:hypothetical protein
MHPDAKVPGVLIGIVLNPAIGRLAQFEVVFTKEAIIYPTCCAAFVNK